MNMNDEIEKLVIMMAVQPSVEDAAKEVEKTFRDFGIAVKCSVRVKGVDINLFKKKMERCSKAPHNEVKTIEMRSGDAIIRVSEDGDL